MLADYQGAHIGDARLVQVEGRSRSVRQSARLRPACRGADTVLGVDIDYQTGGNNMLMVSASGTAVKLG